MLIACKVYQKIRGTLILFIFPQSFDVCCFQYRFITAETCGIEHGLPQLFTGDDAG